MDLLMVLFERTNKPLILISLDRNKLSGIRVAHNFDFYYSIKLQFAWVFTKVRK